MRIPKKLSDVYPASVHKDRHGEWAFNTAWKPLAPVPALAGWLRAIRHGHKRVHEGLGLDLPILVMRSGTSRLDLTAWTPDAMTADTVLDVGHIQRWGPSLGRDVEILTIPDGMHDLTLSAEPVRERVFAGMDRWLGERGVAR
jgi:alpha-beta hydrolase superfamily lysophospholipase